MKKLFTKIKDLAASLLAMLDQPRVVPSVSWNF